MSFLLTKRLARSLWRTKIRLIAVILMVVIGVLGGISMGGYATNVAVLYDNIYEDDEEGVNLPDIWVNLPGGNELLKNVSSLILLFVWSYRDIVTTSACFGQNGNLDGEGSWRGGDRQVLSPVKALEMHSYLQNWQSVSLTK